MNENQFKIVKNEALKIAESDLCHNTTTLVVGTSNKVLSRLTGLSERKIEEWKTHIQNDEVWVFNNMSTVMVMTNLCQTLMFLFSHPELDGKATGTWFEE